MYKIQTKKCNILIIKNVDAQPHQKLVKIIIIKPNYNTDNRIYKNEFLLNI